MADRKAEYGILNIVAQPHPTGIYTQLLETVAKTPVRFWGDDYAAISAPADSGGGVYSGRIIVWTEVDTDSPAIDKSTLAEVELGEAIVNFTENYGINGKTFLYVLRERDHRLFFEAKNELGKSLSPGRAAKIFSALLALPNLSIDDPHVDVFVQPEDDALARVLSIPRLQRLEINITKPNADDISAEAEEVLSEIEEQNARKYKKVLIAEGGKSLEPNERTLAEAELAAFNGFVRSHGNEDGEAVDRSTREYPKIVKRTFEGLASTLAAILLVARDTLFTNGDGDGEDV